MPLQRVRFDAPPLAARHNDERAFSIDLFHKQNTTGDYFQTIGIAGGLSKKQNSAKMFFRAYAPRHTIKQQRSPQKPQSASKPDWGF